MYGQSFTRTTNPTKPHKMNSTVDKAFGLHLSHTVETPYMFHEFFNFSKDAHIVKVDAESLYDNQNGLSERTPLLGPGSSSTQTQYSEKDEPAKDKSEDDVEIKISLFKVLLKTFGWQFVFANIWKLFYDLLVFANPMLLQ